MEDPVEKQIIEQVLALSQQFTRLSEGITGLSEKITSLRNDFRDFSSEVVTSFSDLRGEVQALGADVRLLRDEFKAITMGINGSPTD